ncbi:hypothetical protein OS175_04060 [Marinicella sp. S1101]|uniref:hypothetical protein n=1 Tax=Marinicella marina TaxID=2996016 RepID=UPI00226086B7|nr:hypothetical protein [Marinicella marina]MCX7553041.1 hypothetical protein [Marinicella marina]MDJ1139599.1 hypothetical protein [Marinicella marina]
MKKPDPNIAPMEKMIEQMEFELSQASFGGDRQRVPLLLKQLKEARRILAKMTGDADHI